MNRRALFDSPEQAINVTFHMLMRLGLIVSWSLFALAHLAVALAALWALWLLGVTPQEAAGAIRSALETWPVAVLSAAGASALGAVALYWRAAKAFHSKASSGWLFDYLTQDVVVR
jgi:hypothetical protein